MMFGVQYFVLDAHAFEQTRQPLGLGNRDGANEHGLAFFCSALISFAALRNFSSSGAVDHIRVFEADHRPVGGSP